MGIMEIVLSPALPPLVRAGWMLRLFGVLALARSAEDWRNAARSWKTARGLRTGDRAISQPRHRPKVPYNSSPRYA